MLYQQIAKNKRKTVLVMAGFVFLAGLIGAAIDTPLWEVLKRVLLLQLLSA